MQGYLLVATGAQRYYDMAEAAAASLRLRDPTRPIALVHDAGVTPPADARLFFDALRPIAARPAYVGVLNKLRIYDETPWDETLFVDADCLLMRDGIERYWAAQTQPITIWGANRTSGTVVGRDVPAMLDQFGAKFTAQFLIPNYFFRRAAVTERVFRRANAMLAAAPDLVSSTHQGRPGQYADEPFIGLAMGTEGLRASEAYPTTPDLVTTTWRGRRFSLNFDAGEAHFLKPRRYVVPSRSLLPVAWTRANPLFVHFTGLKPRKLYDSLAADLRARVRAGDAPIRTP